MNRAEIQGLINTGHLNQAQRLAFGEFRTAIKINEVPTTSALLYARATRMQGLYTRAEIVAHHGISLSDTEVYDPDMGKLMVELGNIHRLKRRYGESYKQMEVAREYCLQGEDGKTAAQALWGMGVVKRLEGDFDSAFELLSNAKSECMREHDTLSVGHCLREMGTTERNRGRFAEGLSLLTQAEELYEEHQFKLGTAHASREIGTCHIGLKQNDQALSFYHKALDAYRAMGASLGEANTLVCLGQYYDTVGNATLSAQMYTDARVIFTRLGDTMSVEKMSSPTPLVGLGPKK